MPRHPSGESARPQSQVEQITIALIYKFMDDMDAEAEELGGTRSFFAGDYARFGWARLMAPGLGGFEVLALYSEAIQNMRQNPGVPELFRDIFKNAYTYKSKKGFHSTHRRSRAIPAHRHARCDCGRGQPLRRRGRRAGLCGCNVAKLTDLNHYIFDSWLRNIHEA